MFRKLLIAAALTTAIAFSQTLPAGVTKGPSLGGVTEYDYPNGFRVLLLEDSSSPKLTVRITYLVGSRHEGYGESGMAHLLEHMVYIKSKSGRDPKQELADHGAEFNGNTSYDRTSYFATVTANDDNLKWAIGLEAERMINMRIEKELLDKEMTVVRNEFERGENSPVNVLDQRVVATAYLWHNYGKAIIGSKADIEKVPVNRLEEFYKKYYQPDNAVLTVTGKFDPTKALAYAAETFGRIPKPTRVLDPTYTVEPAQDGERSVELRRVGGNPELILTWHAPAFAHPDSAPMEVLSGILSTNARGGGTGRLYKALVEQKKAVNVGMDYNEMHDPGWVQVFASLSKDQSLADVKKTITDTIAGLATEAPTQDEVDRVKNRITQAMERNMANMEEVGAEMTESLASGDWRLYFLNYEELKRVKPEDVVRVAKAYFKTSNLTTGTYIPDELPDRATIPDAPPIDSQLTGFKTSLTVSQGEVFDPSPANVEKHLTRSKLSGGLKLALLPKSTTGDLVTLTMSLNFGDEQSLKGKRMAAAMAGSLLMRGTKHKTRQQLQDEMVKLNAQISVGGSLSGANASIQTTAANLPAALRLAAEMLREPAFPETEFDQIKKQRLTGLEAAKSDPQNLVTLAFQRAINPWPKDDVRYVSTIEEEIEETNRVTVEDAKKFYEQFYGASYGELVAVGSFDPAVLQKTAEELFGNWKTPAAWKRITTNYSPIKAQNQKIETPDKQNAFFEAGERVRMKDTDPDFPAMVLADQMFGGSSMGNRMFNRVRNQEGLSYGINSNFSAPVEGDAGFFLLAAIANPGNVPKVEASFLDEWKKMIQTGFTAQELADRKKAYLEERRVARAQDGQLARVIAIREEYGRTLQWDVDMDAKLEAVTLEQVNAVVKRHLDTDNITIFKGGDFKAAQVYQ